jgi:hypothetical protein
MRRSFHAVSVLALIAALIPSVATAHAQQAEDTMTNSGNGKAVMDREKAGLRGPVRSVVEEQTFAAWTDQEGHVNGESKSWQKTEYDRDGRIIARWFRGGTSREEFVTRYAYSDTGKLLRRTGEVGGKMASEVVFRYDDKGRLQSITDSKDHDNPIAFHYDANGTKTKIAITKPFDVPEGTAVSRSMDSLFDIEWGVHGSYEGGSTITLYDDQDRPVEVQEHDPSGAITSRAIRVYDAEGRVVEEKMILDDPLKMIPAKQREKMLQESGTSAEELRKTLADFLGGSQVWSVKCVYDARGRKSQTIRNTFNHMEDSTETSFQCLRRARAGMRRRMGREVQKRIFRMSTTRLGTGQ